MSGGGEGGAGVVVSGCQVCVTGNWKPIFKMVVKVSVFGISV